VLPGRIGLPNAPCGKGDVACVGFENVEAGRLKEPAAVGKEVVRLNDPGAAAKVDPPLGVAKVEPACAKEPAGVEKVDCGRLNVPPLTGISGAIAGENVETGRLNV